MAKRLSVLWRDKQIEYTRLTSMSGRYSALLGSDPAQACALRPSVSASI